MFVLAGLLGLFGGGPVSRGVVSDPSGTLALKYERFTRNDTSTTLELRTIPTRTDGLRWIALSADYVGRVRIERVMPEPERTILTDRAVRFGFDPGQAGERGLITITVTPMRMGWVRAEIGAADGPSVAFTQFVYP